MNPFPAPAVPSGHVEPVPRRVRALVDGRTVVDTTRALYLWEWPYYPQFALPAADVDPAVVVEEGEVTTSFGRGVGLGLRTAGGVRPGVGLRYVEADPPAIVGHVRLEWSALEAWFEEDEQVVVHPRNPYVRVDALRSTRSVRVECDGVLLAASPAPVLVFETGLPTRYYLDPTAVDRTRLRPSGTVTDCPYKGRTSAYWSVDTGDAVHADLAWTYAHPAPGLAAIAGLVAFYDERVDVTVDGVPQARPVTHLAVTDG